MGRVTGKVLLVGSVPFDTPAEVFQVVGEGVGDIVSSIPDGEQGYRIQWINMLAATVYTETPWLEVVYRPKVGGTGIGPEATQGNEGWDPTSYDDHMMFRAKKDAGPYRLESLNYLDDAKNSYRDFCTQRDKGVIPPGVRFQVSLPATEDATRWFTVSAEDYAILYKAYEEAMGREIDAICKAIPSEDLLIQWDICMETLAIETNDQRQGLSPWKAPGDPFDRYITSLKTLSAMVDDSVLMGFHLCYGDLFHRHLVEPKDLSVCVRMANAAVKEMPRRVDYFHAPVPRDRDDDSYFEPLENIAIGDAQLFLGLMHHSDGLESCLRRAGAAQRHASGFGVSTECGLGRRDPESIRELLQWHREVADTIK